MQQAHQKSDKAKHPLADKDPPVHADSPVVLGTKQSGEDHGFRPPTLFLPVHPAAQARTPSAPQSLLQHAHITASTGLWLPPQRPAVSVSGSQPGSSPSLPPDLSYPESRLLTQQSVHHSVPLRPDPSRLWTPGLRRAPRQGPHSSVSSFETLGTPPTGQRGLHIFKV